MMRSNVRAVAIVTGSLWLAALTVAVGGCAADRRPVLGSSAAERAWDPSAGAADALAASPEFFEELSRRPLATFDDAVHGALLLGTGESGASPAERLAAARRLGWVGPGRVPEARGAVKAGEAAVLLHRLIGSGGAGTGTSEALGALVRLDVLPENLTAERGLTGAELVAMLAAAADRLPGGPVAEFPRGVSGRVAVAETDGRQAHRAGEGGSPPSSHGAGAMIEDSAAGPVEGGTVDPEAAARVPVASEGGESFGDFEAPSGPAPARTADDGDRGHERARPVPAPLREPRGGEPDVRVRARPEPLPELNEPASAPERSARPETSERSAAEPAAPADEGAVRRRGPQRRFVGGRPLTGRER